MSTIHDRLNIILNQEFKGNVSEFARRVGVPQPTLNNILGERKSKPSADNLEKIINSLELISAEWLLTGKGEKIKNNTVVSEPYSNYGKNDNENEIIRLRNELKEAYIEIGILKGENKILREQMGSGERKVNGKSA